MSLLKSIKELISKKKRPKLRESETYAQFTDMMDYFIVTNSRMPSLDEDVETQHTFWTILYGLLNANKVVMDDVHLLGFSPLLGSHVKPDDLKVYFRFEDDSCNNFSYSIPTIRYLLEIYGKEQLPEDAVDTILKRKEVSEDVKVLIVEFASEYLPNKEKLIDTTFNGLKFSKAMFDLVATYILEEDEPKYEYVDRMLQTKFKGAYAGENMRKFETLLSSKDRDSIAFTCCVLLLKNQFIFLETYMMATRNLGFLQALLAWCSEPSHVKRLRLVHKIDAIHSSEAIIPIMTRVISVMMLKNLADQKYVYHILNDLIYFLEDIPVEIRAKAYCAVVILINRNNQKQGTKKVDLQEAFNMLFGATDDTFLLAVRDFLASDEVYSLFDEYLYTLLKTPYEERMKFIKGHILLLLRDDTVKMIEADEDMNMDLDDLNSVPNLIKRTLQLLPDDAAEKMQMVIESGSVLGRLLPSAGEERKAIGCLEAEDIFNNLKKSTAIAGNNQEKLVGGKADSDNCLITCSEAKTKKPLGDADDFTFDML